MKTIIRNLLMLAAALSVSANALAYDFEVNGICYNILSSEAKTVEVTYEKKSGDTYESDYSGNVVIPEDVIYNGVSYTVSSIGNNAFSNCSNLYSITIGTGIRSINESAFNDCDLKKVIWLPNTPPYGYENVSSVQNYVANDSYRGLDNVTVYPYLSSMFEVGGLKYVPVSPSERTCDAIDCSYNNTASYIVIGKTVNYQGIEMMILDIKNYTCYGNVYIKTLRIDGYDGDMGIYSFGNCNAITRLGISNIGGSIGNHAFNECTGINYISLSNVGGSIGNYAFYNCTGINSVNINTVSGSIGNYAFYNCSNLQSVTISNVMGNIGERAFLNCENLKGIEIPNTVIGIGESCFAGCSSLEYATIGSGISELPASCFSGCSSLPEIVIPSTVGSIENNVFYGCSALARVDIADRQTELALGNNFGGPLFSSCPLDSVYIGGNISYETNSGSGYSPFYRNRSLRAVKITDQETEISENEFYGCTGLKRVELGDGIESIGNYAFSGCSALESFTFGNSLATIGNEAFSDCTAMVRLVSKTEVPPVCGSQALDDINKWTCELFVPQNSLEAYKTAEQWKEFFFITGEEPGGIDIAAKEEISVISRNGYIEITGVENQEVNVYNLSGQLVYSGTETIINVPTKGIYIVKAAGQTFKVAL